MHVNKFKVGDKVLNTGGYVGSLTAHSRIYEVSGLVTGAYGRQRILLKDVEDPAKTGWLQDRFDLYPAPQDERDDWFTNRIDPYDDRIRELERFRHRIEKSWPADKALSVERYAVAGLEAANQRLTDQLAEASHSAADLAKRLADTEATNLRFAGLITEQRARLKAVEHCITTPIQQHQPGEQNVPTKQTMPEFFQTGSMQASANGGARILP